MDGNPIELSVEEQSPDDSPNLSDWVGRTETVVGCVPTTVAMTIHATLGSNRAECPQRGEPLPALWHWYGFPPAVSMEELGSDGHPRLGGFLPPVPFERRMWASGNLTFSGDLFVGEEIEKTSTITAIDQKEGSTGRMVFVSVEHELCGGAGLAIRESQTIVYLPIQPQFTPPPKKQGPTNNLVFDVHQPVSTSLLFRYSAITFNAHRVHFDLPYAQIVEHYPGLIVHGPMQANFLMAEATAWKGRRPDQFSFRGVHPMFHDSDMQLRATKREGGLDLFTVADGGHIGMIAMAAWEK
ncbi:MAG: MaoC family dehydratase N-terminal domain-containing protein [Rhodobacteraceae bacterium]|nr:MaoC family dehydratase N-terminal domain-containing protein [Paracoccaceae bacterium]